MTLPLPDIDSPFYLPDTLSFNPYPNGDVNPDEDAKPTVDAHEAVKRRRGGDQAKATTNHPKNTKPKNGKTKTQADPAVDGHVNAEEEEVDEADIKPDIKPEIKSSTRKRGRKDAATDHSTAANGATGPVPNSSGEWTPAKRAHLTDQILTLGIAALNYEAVAAELGLTMTQLRNALQRGRAGNLRDKILKSVEGFGDKPK